MSSLLREPSFDAMLQVLSYGNFASIPVRKRQKVMLQLFQQVSWKQQMFEFESLPNMQASSPHVAALLKT